MIEKDNVIHDAYCSMVERTIRRLWILVILLIVTLVGSNLAWVIYENQFTEIETTNVNAVQDVTTEKDGNVTIYDGVKINGTSDPKSNNKND